MFKKSIICFLVLAFLNFGLPSDFAFAGSDYGAPSGGAVVAVVVGAMVVIGLIVVGVSNSKKTNAPGEQPREQPQDQKEKYPPKSLNFQQPEQSFSPSGQFAVISW